MRKFINLVALAALLFVPWVAKAQCTDGTPCQFTIAGEDSYGDGWEGDLTIYRNNVQMATFTVSGSTNTQTFTVCQGDLVRIDWSGQDQYYENTFTITGGDGTVYISDGQGYIYAPSGTVVEFAACPTCIPPTDLTATAITSEGLTLNWADTANSGASYSIDYWKDGGDTLNVTTTTTSYTFSGLDANTGYHFAVKAICSADDESTALTGLFGTACGGSTCDMSVQLNGYGFSFYGASLELTQNGASLGTWNSSQTLSVCSTDTVKVIFHPGYYSNTSSTITIIDGGGTAIYTGNGSDNDSVLTTIATPCPSCIPPTALFVDTTDQVSITIGWTPRSDATLFAVYIADSLVSESVTDTFYTFTGLNANTAYTLGVQAICSASDSSNAATIVGRTECGPMSIPFFDNFDSYDNGFWPPCWHRLRRSGTDPSVNAQYHHSGTQAMFLLANNDTTLFCTPTTIPLAGNEIQVSYYAFLNWSSYSTDNKWIKAGVMTDTSDMSTFISLDSVGYHNFNDIFEEREFNTSTLDPTASYWVAWMFYSTNTGVYSSTNRGAIDDVTITQLSDCLRPAAATVGTVGARQVELSWNEVAGANGYTVYYGTVNDPTSSDLESTTSSDTLFTLTGLQPETHYYAWVATNCGGNVSDLRYAGSFTTLVSCPAVNGLAVDSTYADGAIVSWHPGDQENQWLVALDSNEFELVFDSSYTIYGLDAMTGHTVHVRAYCGDDDTSSVQSVNFATSCEDATCLLTVEMTDSYGDGWNNGAVNIYQAGVQVGTATISSGSTGTAAIEVCSSAAVEVRVTSGSYPSEMSFVVHDGGGSAVYTAAQGSITSSSNGSLLTTIANPCPACIMPMGLALDTVSAFESTIHWTAQEGQTSWYVKLDSNEAVAVSDTFYTFTALDALTSYTAYVATDCGGDLSNYASVSFTTLCASSTCDITVDMTDSYGDGWNGNAIEAWQNGSFVGSTTLSSGYNIVGSVSVCSSVPVEFRFHAGNYASEISFTIYDGGGAEIHTAAVGSMSGIASGTVIDSIDNACPSCVRPTGVTVTAVDSNSITFAWDVVDSVYGYLISFDGGAYNFSLSGSETYTGLNPNTDHTFSVMAICSSTDTSSAASVTVHTTCGAMSMPFVEDFDSIAAGNTPTCWTVLSGSPEVDGYSNGHSGTNSLMMSGSDMIVTSLIPLDGDSIHVSFWAKHSGGTLEAGVMTNPLIDTTFIPLVTSTGNGDVYTLYEFNTLTLDHYTNYYVAFRYNAPWNYVYIDDINIRVDDGCLTPSYLTATATGNSVQLSWHNGTSVDDFLVQYRESGSSTWSDEENCYDTVYTITGLNSSSSYEVRVGLICGGDTLWTSTSFLTPCGLMSLPYYENFDAYANNVLPPCWTYDNTVTHGDGGLFFSSYSSGGNGNYAVVPQLDGNIAKLKIEFDAKVGTIAENDAILIGVADATGTLLVWLDTIQDPNFSRNAFVRKTVYFPNYTMPSNAARVVFAQYRYWNEWALVDNINIEELPDCYPVDNLTGHNLDDIENTTFTWTPVGTASQWQVYFDTVTVDIDSLASMPVSNFINVYDTTYTIPIGLIQGGGIYNFFVRSNCGNDQSSWVKSTFGAGTIIMNQTSDTVTGCGFVVYDNGGPIAGYLANTNATLVLRSENAGSQLEVFGGIFGFGMDPATLTIYDGEGTTGTVLYTYNTVNGRDTLNSVLATSTTGSLTINFTVSGTMCHTGYELYVRCTGAAVCPRPTELSGEMTSATQALVTWNGTAPSYDFYYRISPDGTWVRQTVNADSVVLTGLVADTVYDMYVVALCSATDSSMASVMRQLNTHYEIPVIPCPAPVDLTVSNITLNSAVIGWTSMGTESAWRLEVNGALVTGVTTNPYTLSGLDPATSYTVKVQAVCDATTMSDWSNALVFSTQEEDTSAVYFTVTVTSSNPGMGSVTGTGTYEEGSTITITATSNPGYHFVQWNDGNTDSIRTVVVTGNLDFIAQFASNAVQSITETSIQDVSLYPNPASGSVTLMGIEGEATVTIVDINGRELHTQTFKQSSNQAIKLDISSLTSGAYFVRLTSVQGTIIRKLIVTQ